MLLDDSGVNDWRGLIQIHPMSCHSQNLDDYRDRLQAHLFSNIAVERDSSSPSEGNFPG